MKTPACLDFAKTVDYVGDAQSARSLLGTLERSLSEDLPRLQALLDAGEVAKAQGLLHQIKGFAPVFCSQTLAQDIAALERLSKGGDLQAVRMAHQQLTPQLQQLLGEVRAQIAAA